VLGAAIALRVSIGLQTVGQVMGFGSGVLISAVAVDLVEEAVGTASGHGATIVGLLAGCLTFFAGDVLIDRAGGAGRKSASAEPGGSAMAIVLGTVLDGIPESIVNSPEEQDAALRPAASAEPRTSTRSPRARSR
jgi:ZIP family zinc transporter